MMIQERLLPVTAILAICSIANQNCHSFTINSGGRIIRNRNRNDANLQSTRNTLLYSTSETIQEDKVITRSLSGLTIDETFKTSTSTNNDNETLKKFWEIGSTGNQPYSKPLTPELQIALETNTHPVEMQDDLGKGIFITRDWRKAWFTYGNNDNDAIIDPITGAAEYEIDDIEGEVPNDLVGVLYRNGPGKFGVNGERVKHVLDADGLIVQVTFPPVQQASSTSTRKFTFKSKFVQTKGMIEEEEAQRFLYRGTFGTAPWKLTEPPKRGLNEDPWEEQPLACKIMANAFKTDIKNTANTQIISFGGKLLALFEAGLPHEIDPVTLDTIGEYDMEGRLPKGKLPVKLGIDVPEQFMPAIIGGSAHTAHPNVCPETGNLVGWHWSQLVTNKALEVTFTEWSKDNFNPIATSTFNLPGCELAPHDMALSSNYIMLKVNSLKMNQLNFLTGLKGPAASLEMDGQANVFVHVFPRPTATEQFEPFVVEVPPCFSIHFSHAYEDTESGNIVSFFSGWPPSDSKDFLGAWGGFAPDFSKIPPTFYWRLEIDPKERKCVNLGIAPGAQNACIEHLLVHPNFTTSKAMYSYGVASNLVGDSTAPCGYAKIKLEDDDITMLKKGEKNEKIDAYFFGTRYFAGEPLIVPKHNSDRNNEEAAYLLGMIYDAVRDKAGVAVFDLEKNLKDGPVATLWMKSSIPHGLHGCFSNEDDKSSSVFC